jgi:Rps23 Pro-64 3,4-dihydroxylase Tpa1-like proline 4-hydroxylase
MIDLDVKPDVRDRPFSHVSMTSALSPALVAAALEWMESDAPWKLRIESFYEQWELHLDTSALPSSLHGLCAQGTIDHLESMLVAPLNPGRVELAEITAHKLLAGQTIRIHNDYLEGEETYRVLIQLNRGWLDEQGGMLMLFSTASPDDLCRVIRPLHGSAFAFGISPLSFHAVSTIRSGERYTLVYSFRQAPKH